ncbi:MAG: phosphoglycerate mutase [Elusimicrobia bacterium]|nr:MAG: phosphoglycerate mutase [Gammaproteobacteria bacterium]TXH24791.1 MAG: phosphoglycerate mutase [Elusimicrobiota bacterium]
MSYGAQRKLILLLPLWRRCLASEVLASGALAGWCSRGQQLDALDPGNDGILASCFEWSGGSLPVAALRRQAELGDAGDSNWLCADPAHVRADMATARMLACGAMGLTDFQRERIARDLGSLFGDAGFEFDAPGNERWYVRAMRGSELPLCGAPDEVMGDDLKLHLPAGTAGRLWRRLFNDAQVLLHNHRVNSERAARGAISINSLWFWGGGVLPNRVRAHVHHVVTDRLEVRALAERAGIAWKPLRAESLVGALADAESDAVIALDLVELRDRELESGWLQAVQDCLRTRQVDLLELRFASGERFCVNRWQRMKFWKPIQRLGS